MTVAESEGAAVIFIVHDQKDEAVQLTFTVKNRFDGGSANNNL